MDNGHKIRVLHITFNMGIGGTEQVICQLVTNLDTDRYKSTVLCIDGQVGALGDKLRNIGIPVLSMARNSGLDLGLVWRIRELILRENIQVVHCHQYTPYTYGWFATRFTGVALVFTEHGRFHPDRYRVKAVLINPVMSLTTSAVTAISCATKRALQRYEFIPGWKVQVIYNGISGLLPGIEDGKMLKAELGIRDDELVLGTIARLDKVKNQAMMLRAFKVVKERHPKTKLVIVGDGDERPNLENLVNTLELESDVLFTGFIVEPKSYLEIMDLFLLSSFTEGTSMTLLEAMSLGIPSVVTNVGGNPEIVQDGSTGVVIPSDDPIAFSEAINHLLANTETRLAMGVNAMERFKQNYSIEKMLDRFKRLYQTVTKAKV